MAIFKSYIKLPEGNSSMLFATQVYGSMKNPFNPFDLRLGLSWSMSFKGPSKHQEPSTETHESSPGRHW